MIEQWYYWHELEILGPFSGKQLVDLAASGDILPDDIVWREGVEGGVPAHKVQHLFAAQPTASPAAEASASEATPVAVDAVKPAETAAPAASKVVEPVKSTWESVGAATGGKSRATAGKGTIIVGQDGKTVKFRMKCITCGHEDSSYQSMTITRGTFRKVFYCPKCRKRCSVELNGFIG